MTFVVDAERAEQVLDAILDRYKRGAYPYNVRSSMLDEFELPKRLKRGGEAEARFWFFACMLMRGGIDSDTGLKILVRLYDQTMVKGGPKPFNPSSARKMNPVELTKLLELNGKAEQENKPHRFAIDWIDCAQLICDRYDGKVLNIVERINNYEDVVSIVLNLQGGGFPGFQYKMVSMICFFWIEAGLLEPFPYPPPVDFHLIRVAVATRIVYRTKDQKILVVRSGELIRLQAALRMMYLDYIIASGVSTNDLADALWLHSRMMCRFNPGNKTTKGEYAARQTKITPHVVDLAHSSDQRKFEKSCKRCPVRQKCLLNVPSAYYYTLGRIETSERVDNTPVLNFELD